MQKIDGIKQQAILTNDPEIRLTTLTENAKKRISISGHQPLQLDCRTDIALHDYTQLRIGIQAIDLQITINDVQKKETPCLMHDVSF